MHRLFSLWLVGLLLLTTSSSMIYGQAAPLDPWYPFLKGSKWGFIDALGHWKIQPQFDDLHDVFDHETVRVWVNKKCGYVDRSGAWLAKPQFDSLEPYFGDTGYLAVTIGKKAGILNRQGIVVLPVKYDEVLLSSTGAWVRREQALGVFGLDGKWIHEITIPWPTTRSLIPVHDSGDVAWIQETRGEKVKWGVIDAKGTIVFHPNFESHILGRKEAEEWNRPEGTDFKHGKAWVVENGHFQLITSSGDILCKTDFDSVRPWSDTLCIFTEGSKVGLVSEDGKIVLGPDRLDIKIPANGFAQYSSYKSSGEQEGYWISGGYLSIDGRIIVEPGKYFQCHDFSEGLAAVSKQSDRGGHGHDPQAVFINAAGQEALSFDQYYTADSFSEGLAAVMELGDPGNGSSPNGGNWGFINIKGQEQIAPKFGWTTPFYHSRAWVCDTREKFDHPRYAMIDTSGKVLTDFKFNPPEKDKEYFYPADKLLAETRWRGNLAVINSGWQTGLGLATAEGKILIEPQFNELGPLTDGMIRTITLKGEDRWMGYVDEKGKIAIPATYTGSTDFEEGAAWVTTQPNDHRIHLENKGWMLIDHQGKVLTTESYLSPSFIVEEHYRDLGGLTGVPQFIGGLACVASAKTYQPYGENRLRHLSWGYIDHIGHVVAWHPAEAK